ncbi:zinc-dependent alcohol dehydrogenase family protein [Methylophaga sulfidovorans]|uniref:NADPH:quinone reductase n=1 Tax=Methylophaga sulfidovorans TaxID=45496 RepID=A0A1I4BPV8_9GAMM|nr:zinc-dependent alcohol dehydrogenase family protein [Methylophaga sulfidovorans]SFK70207.1 NADPH:quinone reductase [Methylophaga sulfidovorans]
MSKTVQISEAGEPSVLSIIDETVPAPSADEVQIEVHAIGLNRAEAMFRRGQYLEAPEFPARIGYECSGSVTAVGENVKHIKVGDAVSTIPNFSMNQYGAYAELTNMPVTTVTHHPDNLSWQQATSVWMQYLTAYGALIDLAKMQASDYVLIPAASSSVGLAAIQLCNLISATPIAMTRTAEKVEQLHQLGAKHVIISEQDDVVDAVMAITDGHGVNIVFDPVAGPMLTTLAEACAPSAIIFQYGALSSEPTPYPLFAALQKGLTIRAYTLFELTSSPERLAKAKEKIFDWLKHSQLSPVIAKTFDFDDIVAAHSYLEANNQLGKIVITL